MQFIVYKKNYIESKVDIYKRGIVLEKKNLQEIRGVMSQEQDVLNGAVGRAVLISFFTQKEKTLSQRKKSEQRIRKSQKKTGKESGC